MGIQLQKISKGDGEHFPKKGQQVTVHYTGTLENGTKFDSSYDRNTPFKFRVGKGEVIRGWDEGILQLSLGEKVKLILTPDYAYGEKGIPGIIPPNSKLIFEVQLLSIIIES